MAGLRYYISNRMEELIQQMAKVLKKPLASPLDKEIVVVQSRGMERWVSMELARQMRVCANYDFIFPEHLVIRLFQNVLDGLTEESILNTSVMTWMLMKILPSLIHEPDFESLSNYLHEDRLLKQYQLCRRIAEVFDKYNIYRPHVLLDWQNGYESHWQAQLWRDIVLSFDKTSFAILKNDFIASLQTIKELPQFPERISFFGISSLPPFYLQVLKAVSAMADIHLYFMNPCKEYWADIVTSREIEKISRRYGKGRYTPEELHLEIGNSLLASMGTVGREFFKVLGDLESGNFLPLTFELFLDPGENTLLEAIQSDIMNLREIHSPKRKIREEDDTIQVHVCHSAMREMEVLYDNLLALFDSADSTLEPRDVLIMTPDISTYTPFIEAVFGGRGLNEQTIPFSIADRPVRAESSIVETFLKLLELPGSRFGASAVVELLESPEVSRAIDLGMEDVDTIRKWVYATRICWGVDGTAKARMNLPAFSENTWQAGQDRLMLGYCMKGDQRSLFSGILPFEGMDGSEGTVLGRFIDFLDKLFMFAGKCENSYSLNQWAALLRQAMTDFFSPEEDKQREAILIQEVLDELADKQGQSGYDEPVDFETVKHYLTVELSKDRFNTGFITGGITFCTLLPMRSIPFRVIALVGMDTNAFPRVSKNIGFDLTTLHPLPCDPGRTKEDRYLFLEAIISAREKLYISCVGQDIHDNSEIPPSVLVSELLDYIDQGFEYPDGRCPLHGIVHKHRLHAFAPQYFSGKPGLFSYSAENFEACVAEASENRHGHKPFFIRQLTKPDDSYKTVDVEHLAMFFNNPARFLLNKRLGLYLEDRSFTFTEREPFALNALDRYFLCQRLIEQSLKGLSLDRAFQVIQAEGMLPHGNLGRHIFESVKQEVSDFLDKVYDCSMGEPMLSVLVNIPVGDFNVTGTVPGIYTEGVMGFRCANVKAGDLLRMWVYHLALYVSGQSCKKSVFVGRDQVWQFFPVEDGTENLEMLLEKYWEGLIKPLAFFPQTALEYVKTRKSKGHKEAFQRAVNIWQGNNYKQGEVENPYFSLCFGDNFSESEFICNVEAIFEPLLQHGSAQ